MSLWQRRARFGFGLFAVVFGVILFFAIGEREQPAVATPPERIDPKATVETRGGDVIQLKGARQDVRVEFGGQVTYSDGQSKLLDVKAYIDNRAGRNFVITGKEGRLGANQSSIDITGDVTLTTSDGLTATATEAHYVEAEGIVKAPGPVQFQRGRMTGSGVGFTYDRQRDTIWLLDQAVVRFAAEGEAPPMDVAAGAAGFARADRYLRFERQVKLVREGQVVEGDEATVRLLPDRDEPDAIEIRGNSRITGGTGTGSLQAMQGRDMNLDYAIDGRTLERVVLAGQAGIQIQTPSGRPGQQLSAEWIDLTLAPDGAVTSLSSRENVRVTLPAASGGPPRVVASGSLAGSGAAGQGLTVMNFAETVEYREGGEQGRPARVARSRTLDLTLAPATGDVQEARFAGGFRFEEGRLHATSASAAYQIPQGLLALTGRDGNRPPHLEDAQLTVDADAIEVTLAPRRLAAKGSVGSVLLAGREGRRRQSLLSGQEAVFVTADRLSFDEEKSSGVYSGQARLWQGDTVIRAETITLDDRNGDLTATGQVVSTLALASAGKGATASAKPTPTIARAAEFRYDDGARRATYTRTAQVNGPDGDLSGDVIDLLLAADQNALDRLDAKGGVRALVDRREATGASLTYHPSDARYVLVGAPVRLIEECRETTGQTLTFFRASDRILIDGNEERRTQTRGGAKCPEPRFD
jgi:lipopolysaccharide export system protein LptA